MTCLVKNPNFLYLHIPVERSYTSKILSSSYFIATARVQSGVAVSWTGSCPPERKGPTKVAHNLTPVYLACKLEGLVLKDQKQGEGEVSPLGSSASKSFFVSQGRAKKMMARIRLNSYEKTLAFVKATQSIRQEWLQFLFKERQTHATFPTLPDAGPHDERKGELLTVRVYVFIEFCLCLTVGSVTGFVWQPWWHGGCCDYCLEASFPLLDIEFRVENDDVHFRHV